MEHRCESPSACMVQRYESQRARVTHRCESQGAYMASLKGNFGQMCNFRTPRPLPGVACENNAIARYQDFFPPPSCFAFRE